MALRERLQGVASRLTAQFGDTVQLVTLTTTQGETEFDPPTVTETLTPVPAVVTGAGRWADQETIRQTDLIVIVSGEHTQVNTGDQIKIDGDNHEVILKRKILASGVASAIRYFVRRG